MAKTKRKQAKGKCRRNSPGTRQTNKATKKVDHRRQLFNDRKCGPIELVQLPVEMITRFWGVVFDIDPDLFRIKTIPAAARTDPEKFYKRVVRPWLSRHAVLNDAEVRCSGRGLHVILWFDRAVEFTTDGERKRWAGIVQSLQALLPTDPDAPGITATTRALGSTNSKNGVKVTRLHRGRPVPVQAVLDLFGQLRSTPFRTVMQILFGTDRVRPCPVCDDEDSTLAALDRVGACYGSCGKVELARLFDVFLKPRSANTGQ
jgi:hypothetical protein